jgi:hypothetical protein
LCKNNNCYDGGVFDLLCFLVLVARLFAVWFRVVAFTFLMLLFEI